MPRLARVIAIGYPHHVTQRGNYKQNIFRNNSDRDKYLKIVAGEAAEYKVNILAYCLMNNHVHFIAVPEEENSLGNAFKYINMKYAQYFNRKTGMGGHLWQGRFYSSVMDEQYTLLCARYIERNPVRAGLAKKPCDWSWSSAKTHCGLENDDRLGVNRLFKCIRAAQREWQEYISIGDVKEDIGLIKKNTMRGSVVGAEDFIKRLGTKLGRNLFIKNRGRPKKEK